MLAISLVTNLVLFMSLTTFEFIQIFLLQKKKEGRVREGGRKETFEEGDGFIDICMYPCSSKYVDLNRRVLCHRSLSEAVNSKLKRIRGITKENKGFPRCEVNCLGVNPHNFQRQGGT